MSWEATNWAVRQTAGSPVAKLLLLLLADRADENHSCFPSLKLLAPESESSVATVKRHLDRLRDDGLIEWTRGGVPMGQGRFGASNRYVLPVDRPIAHSENLVTNGSSKRGRAVTQLRPTAQKRTTNGSRVSN
jgi:DNA-binding transcriptional MocR family regulator